MKLRDIASVIRTKNSGPYELTMDIMLPDDETYEKLLKAQAITKPVIASLYKISEEDVLSIVWFDKARAVKATIRRPLASGDVGERDVYGAQQHAPLMNLEVRI